MVWLLSPIGGQGSLRQMSIIDASTETPISLTYMLSDGNTTVRPPSNYYDSHIMQDAMLLASLLGSPATKAFRVDFWNNIKIPMIEYYEAESNNDGDGWLNFESQSVSQHNYSSLVGIPMSDVTRSPLLYYAMSVDTMYFHLGCTTPMIGDRWVPEGASDTCFRKSKVFDTPTSCIWWTEDIINGTANREAPFKFGYSSNVFTEPVVIRCAVTTTYIEIDIRCSKLVACETTRIRRSTLPQPRPASTLFDIPGAWNYFIDIFTKSVQIGQGLAGAEGYPTLLDTYLAFPNNPGMIGVANLTLPKHDDETYALALGQLMNTYWTILNAPFAITGGLKNETSYLGSKARTWPTQGTKTTYSRIIRAQRGWVAALAISSAILVLAGIVPPVLRIYQRGPDIMINVSGLATRYNPHVPLTSQGSWMDAGERVRLLGDVKVRFGDVDGTSDVGNLDIGEVGVGMVSRVRKGRVYD